MVDYNNNLFQREGRFFSQQKSTTLTVKILPGSTEGNNAILRHILEFLMNVGHMGCECLHIFVPQHPDHQSLSSV